MTTPILHNINQSLHSHAQAQPRETMAAAQDPYYIAKE